MLVPLLAGCIRVQVSMGVSANDRVTGQVVAAAIPANEADKGPQLTPPSSLEDKIRVQEYKKDGYVGSQAFFSDLSFGDVAQLGSMYAEGSGSFQITLKRSGDTVTLDGKADLKTVPTQGADVQGQHRLPGTGRHDQRNTRRRFPGVVDLARRRGVHDARRGQLRGPKHPKLRRVGRNHGRAGARCRDCRRCDGLDGAQSSTDQARAPPRKHRS